MNEENISSKSRLITLLLCLFLGPLGIHRFYAGKTVSAVILLIVSVVTASIVGWIWQIVDVILITTGNLSDGEGKLIRKWGD